MADITLSAAVRNNLLALQNTADLLGRTQERLATGLKVNSALDDPTAFFTASSLNSRAGDLNRLLDSVGNALQTIRAADNGLSAITKLVENAQATARQALQAPVGTVSNVATSLGGTSIAADAAGVALGTNTGGIAADTAATLVAADGAVAVTDAGANSGAAAVLNDLNLGAEAFENNDTLAITIDGVTETFTFLDGGAGGTTDDNVIRLQDANKDNTTGDNATVATLVSAINTVFGAGHAAVAANVLTITDNSGNTSEDLTVTFTNASDNTASGNQALLTSLGYAGVTGAAAGSLTQEPDNAEIGITGALSFTINGNTDTINFGTDDSSNQVSNKSELIARLSALSASSNTGATFELVGDQIRVTAAAGTDGDITVGATGAAAGNGASGFANGAVFEPTNSTLAALVANGDALTVSNGTSTDTITFGTDDSSSEVSNLAELTAALGSLTNTGATGTITTNNQVQIVGASGDTITIGDTNARTTLGLQTTTAPVQTVSNTERADLEATFNLLRTQIDELAADASFNGVNLLNGDNLTVIFNEGGTSTLAITGVTFDASGLGISAAATGDFQTDSAINARLAELDTAVDTLRSQAATFGANLSVVEIRQDFTKNLINTLETGAANLTLADSNEEGANTLALQTRQQLSSVALSLSAQADQNVLRLF